MSDTNNINKQSQDRAFEMLEKYKSLTKDDFWLLERKLKSGFVTKLVIIKHNGCLKIANEKGLKLKPEGYKIIKEETKDVVIGYYDDRLLSGFEVGEASALNCKSDYPWAIALKRCQDRALLKILNLAEEGIYSEEEAEEFKEKIPQKNYTKKHDQSKAGGGRFDESLTREEREKACEALGNEMGDQLSHLMKGEIL